MLTYSPTAGVSRRRLLTAGLGAAGAAIALPVFAAPPTPTFYDPRFARAQALAAKLAGGRPLTAAPGDPAEVLAALKGKPAAQGVTTETLPFCLEHAFGRRPASLLRVDQDLFAWSFDLRGA